MHAMVESCRIAQIAMGPEETMTGADHRSSIGLASIRLNIGATCSRADLDAINGPSQRDPGLFSS
jgi:hypothetical protein